METDPFMSLVEAVASVVGGYGIAIVTQLIVFPWFGLPAHLEDALAIGFTAVSIARSFVLRRLFEMIRLPAAYTQNEKLAEPRAARG